MSESIASTGRLRWFSEAPAPARRALIAASLGWMLDSFDVMLYALVLSSLMKDLGIGKQQAGMLGSVTLIAGALGGIVFGYIADRFGRTKALMGSVLLYAIFTAACGFAQTVPQLAVFRILLGIGMGGEWASGAALVSETWPAEHRGKALGIVQSSWAIGYALAAVTAGIVLPWMGWRAVFFVGVLPAILALLFRSKLEESKAWQQTKHEPPRKEQGAWNALLGRRMLPLTCVLTGMNACTLFAWWGFNLWVPAFLSLPVKDGGVGLTTQAMAGLIVTMQAGMWFGYVSFGFLSDRFGRKPCYVVYLIMATITLFFYGHTRNPVLLLCLGPMLAFWGTGYFSGFATVTAELYETRIRATAQGLTYNAGRIVSALAPFVVGDVARKHGFAAAFDIAAGAFLLAALFWIWIPETKQRVNYSNSASGLRDSI
jgi:MFS family permease